MALALVGDDRLERVAAIRRLLRDDVSILANVSIHGARIDTPEGMSEFLMAGRVDLTHVELTHFSGSSGQRRTLFDPPFYEHHLSVSSVRGRAISSLANCSPDTHWRMPWPKPPYGTPKSAADDAEQVQP